MYSIVHFVLYNQIYLAHNIIHEIWTAKIQIFNSAVCRKQFVNR